MQDVGTGFETIDRALGGLITGDNVVWICDDEQLYGSLVGGFVASAVAHGHRCIYIDFGTDRSWMTDRVEVVDATATSAVAAPVRLADLIDEQVRRDPTTCLVVDELDRPLDRWGLDATVGFFARVCPSMLDAGVTAYWSLSSRFGPLSLETVRQITQCQLDVRNERLRIMKAEGRPSAETGVAHRLQHDSGRVELTSSRASGRLARGLLALRRDLDLTQAELAGIGGVTASAISQAESGARGLSIDTLVTIADRLGVSLDRLVGGPSAPSYQLARHDRSRRITNEAIGLFTDATAGLRSYLVDVAPGATGSSTVEPAAVETIVVLSGLVQIDTGDDRPVLRHRDALTVADGGVRSWVNLGRRPASFVRVLRD